MGEKYIEELVDEMEVERRYLLAHAEEDIARMVEDQKRMPSARLARTGATIAEIAGRDVAQVEHRKRFSPKNR